MMKMRAQGRQQLLDHAVSDSPGWLFAVHLYTADATKARVWQDSAIHTTMVTSAFTSEPVLDDSDFDAVCGGLEERFLVGDLQVIQDKSAEGTLGCIRKQLAAIGGILGGLEPVLGHRGLLRSF